MYSFNRQEHVACGGAIHSQNSLPPLSPSGHQLGQTLLWHVIPLQQSFNPINKSQYQNKLFGVGREDWSICLQTHPKYSPLLLMPQIWPNLNK